jgi:aryl carrier-like protein
MVPAVWMKLDALPLNANGKVDRAALPAPAGAQAASFIAARTPTERGLAEIWADVLGRERVSIDDDIFTLGADSIQIFQITARANRRGLALLAKQLMKHRTIAELAKALDAAGPLAPASSRLPLRAARSASRPSGERHAAPLA